MLHLERSAQYWRELELVCIVLLAPLKRKFGTVDPSAAEGVIQGDFTMRPWKAPRRKWRNIRDERVISASEASRLWTWDAWNGITEEQLDMIPEIPASSNQGLKAIRSGKMTPS